MRKNIKYIVFWMICFVVGLILMVDNETPYHVCISWLEHPDDMGEYIYASQHILSIAIGYFGGIALMIISPIIMIICFLKNGESEKAKKRQDDLNNLID